MMGVSECVHSPCRALRRFLSLLLAAACSDGVCFNGGICVEGSAQLCRCPAGFRGARCQYGKQSSQVLPSVWSRKWRGQRARDAPIFFFS